MRKTALLILGIFLLTTPLLADQLNDFEEDVTEEEDEDDDEEEDEDENEDEDSENNTIASHLFSLLFEFFFRMLGYSLVHGGIVSWNMVNPEHPGVLFGDEAYYTNIRPRKLGEPIIPFIKLDANSQYINRELIGIHGLLESGFGPIGLQYEHLHFLEFNPRDALYFDKVCGYYRMVFAAFLEWDLGGGFILMTGNDTYSGGVMSFPVHFLFGNIVALEFRPEWWFMYRVNTISHYDLSLHYCVSFFTLHLGYKWIRGPSSNLNGFVLGFSFRF